jgi:hypothetical protein
MLMRTDVADVDDMLTYVDIYLTMFDVIMYQYWLMLALAMPVNINIRYTSG